MKRGLMMTLIALIIIISVFFMAEVIEAQRPGGPDQRRGGFSEEDVRRFRSRMEAGSSQSICCPHTSSFLLNVIS